LAVPSGMLLLSMPKPHASILAGRLGTLTLVLAITGILALLAWQSLFPSRRDYQALAGLPVTSRQIFIAHFTCVLFMEGAITLVMISSMMAKSAPAAGLGCTFVFFSIVAAQGALINILPPRLFARLAVPVQACLLTAFILAALYSF